IRDRNVTGVQTCALPIYQADIAWIIVATALVFLMTPGLAFFYGGMVHRKNVLSTMIKSIVASGIVSVLWVVVGFSLCFGKSVHRSEERRVGKECRSGYLS